MADLGVSDSESSDIDAGDGGFEEDLDGEAARPFGHSWGKLF